ncbi:MAG: hypothetical protein COA79_00855 [Planctomycetota bacterium]|nr:MAG: hypothetical protein COA79_00855 [Planctomycetota bacterium]
MKLKLVFNKYISCFIWFKGQAMNVKFLLIAILFMMQCSLFSKDLHPHVKLNGYSSFEFEYEISDKGDGDKNGSFDADSIDLVFNIYPVNRLRFAIDISYEHGTATEDNRGNVAMEYAFGEYTYNEYLKIRFGKMFSHFGIYNEIHTAKTSFLTFKEPKSTNKISKVGGGDFLFYPRWQVGLAVTGEFDLADKEFDYILQLSNGDQGDEGGQDTNPFESDNNTQKAFGGRFRYNILEDLRLGLSFYHDIVEEYDDDLDPKHENPTGQHTSVFSYGFQAEYQIRNLTFEFEYTGGFVDPSSGSSIDRYGVTLLGAYTFKDKYTPYVRLEYFDPNQDVSNDEATIFICGLNIEVLRWFNVKVEINRTWSEDGNLELNGKNTTQFNSSFVIGF